MEVGLLVFRAVVGAFFVGHGSQKLFGGHGLAGTGGTFEQMGLRPGRAMAAVAGLSQSPDGAGPRPADA
jgi:putative oxidoreductase